MGTGEALPGPRTAVFSERAGPITGETAGKWVGAGRESEGVVVAPEGTRQQNSARCEGPLRRRCKAVGGTDR